MAAGDFLEVYTEEGTVSLSLYLFQAKGLTWQVTHEVARSITTSGMLEGFRPFHDFPALVSAYAADDSKRLF